MSKLTFPNESSDYRQARNALLQAESELRDQVEKVAAMRRSLPLGGLVDPTYQFERVSKGAVEAVPLGELFGDKNTLLLYSYMFGPSWDHPCPSCTNIIDAFDRAHYAVTERVAFAVVAKASAKTLAAWADSRNWARIPLVSAEHSSYLVDYHGQSGESENSLMPMMNVFVRREDAIHHFWASELLHSPSESGHARHMDMAWPLWNLLDMTPDGRGEIMTPRQDYDPKYFNKHYMGGD